MTVQCGNCHSAFQIPSIVRKIAGLGMGQAGNDCPICRYGAEALS